MKLKNLLTIAICSLFLFGCGNSGNNVEDTKETIISSVTITDLEGNNLVLPSEIDTIISLAPSITSSLVNLGLEDKIIAVDTYSLGTQGISEEIQAFDMLSPDIESIVSLQADIIFVSGMSKVGGEDPFSQVKELGTVITYIPTANSLEDIKNSIIFLGNATHKKDEAEKIVEEFEQKITEIKEKIENEGTENKTVYFEISPAPNLYSFGEGVFLNEIIVLLGGENIFGEEQSWISVTEEEVLARNPNVIFTNTYLEDPVTEILTRNGWGAIDAVKNNSVYRIDSNNSSQSNEFVILAIEEMAKSLYPEIFNEE